MQKDILIVGFEKKNQLQYPHLKQTIEYFKQEHVCEYIHFYERGYFVDCKFSFSPIKLFRSIYTLIRVIADILKALYLKFFKKYKTVIAIDNFSYIIYSTFFNHTILWSHDFVTDDQQQAECYFQKKIKALTVLHLKKNKKLMIQDEERLTLFKETYFESAQIELEIFFFPVSLLPVRENIKQINKSAPILMQIGGINSFRSASDKLIDDYQLNHAKYDLFLHGYVMDDIKQQILRSEYLPTTSTIELSPDEVYKVVEKGDIGFICYNSVNKNFFYTKFASGQIVEFLRCSKPVIVFGHSNMKEFVNDKKIGVGIDNISDLATAIYTIAENYTEYQDASKKYFDEIYNIELYLNGLGEWVYD